MLYNLQNGHVQWIYADQGQFHKTLQILKLRICSYTQILTVNLLINCKNSVIYGKMAINYEEKSFIEQAPGGLVVSVLTFYLLHLFEFESPLSLEYFFCKMVLEKNKI